MIFGRQNYFFGQHTWHKPLLHVHSQIFLQSKQEIVEAKDFSFPPMDF